MNELNKADTCVHYMCIKVTCLTCENDTVTRIKDIKLLWPQSLPFAFVLKPQISFSLFFQLLNSFFEQQQKSHLSCLGVLSLLHFSQRGSCIWGCPEAWRSV